MTPRAKRWNILESNIATSQNPQFLKGCHMLQWVKGLWNFFSLPYDNCEMWDDDSLLLSRHVLFLMSQMLLLWLSQRGKEPRHVGDEGYFVWKGREGGWMCEGSCGGWGWVGVGGVLGSAGTSPWEVPANTGCTHFLNSICLLNVPPLITWLRWMTVEKSDCMKLYRAKLLIGEGFKGGGECVGWGGEREMLVANHWRGHLRNLASLIWNQESGFPNCNQTLVLGSSLF